MKIHVASDMHLEFWHPWHMRVVGTLPECDVLVLAGDILSLRLFDVEDRAEVWKWWSRITCRRP